MSETTRLDCVPVKSAPFLAFQMIDARYEQPFTVAAIVIFAIVALMHLLRLVLGWDATIAGTEIPMWVSVAALVIAGSLSVGLWREKSSR